MKRKVGFLAIIAVLVASLLAMTACGGDGKKKITLVDFPATVTEEAMKLGEVYELRKTVEDTDGKSYSVSAQVKTAGGGDVNVVGSRFELTDVSGYVVTYSVTVAEGDVRTSVITIPVYDDTPPVVNIATPADGLVNELYTLPAIEFSDASAIVEKSVKVYYVPGGDAEPVEQTVSEAEGVYTFTPSRIGTYRITAYAKDAANNEFTRTIDFTVDVLLDGEAFNPESLGARAQLRTNKDPGTLIEYVPAAENDDEAYGGAYWRVVPDTTGWVDTYLTPRMDISEYAKYDVITMWIYVESSSASGSMKLSILKDDSCAQTVNTLEWTLIEMDAAKFVEKIGTQYLYAISYGSITGARIGEINARYSVEYTVSDPVVTTVTTEPATVSFDVTAAPSGIPYTVTVTDSDGNTVDTFEKDGDSYTYSIATAGDYTISVSSANEIYYGSASKTVTVKNDMRIEVDGDYPQLAETGYAITLDEGQIISAGTPLPDPPVRKVYAEQGSEWVDVTAEVEDNAYTPTAAGRIKIEYTATDVDPVEYIITVIPAGEAFNPESLGARAQLRTNKDPGTLIEYVPAAENDDETYGGAYWRVVPDTTDWVNTYLTPRMDISEYAKYDVITMWIYVESSSASGPMKLSLLNDADCAQTVYTNQWSLVQMDAAKFVEKIGAQYLYAIKYGTITGARIGEINARYSVEYTVSDPVVTTVTTEPATVSFDVTAAPSGIPYTVTVTDSTGNAVDTFEKDGDSYTYSIATAGDYTISVSSANEIYYGSASKTVTVKNDMRIEVDGDYPQLAETGYAIALDEGQIISAGTPLPDPPVRKVYAEQDSEWVDVTAEVEDNAYTPTAAGRIKIEYTATDVDPVEYIITVIPAGEVFDPEYSGAESQLRVNKAATITYVPASENDDETYGGAYWSVVPDTTDWANTYLTPRMEASAYSKYDVITMWIYVESSSVSGSMNLPLLNDGDCAQTVYTNQWSLVQMDAAKFVEKIGAQYLYAISYGTITGARIGEIMGRYSVEYTVSDPVVTTVTTEPATVSFDVTAAPSGVPYTVTVTDSTGNAVDTFEKDGDSYTYSIATAGDYTISVSSANEIYYGSASKTVTVKNDARIEVEGEYPDTVERTTQSRFIPAR